MQKHTNMQHQENHIITLPGRFSAQSKLYIMPVKCAAKPLQKKKTTEKIISNRYSIKVVCNTGSIGQSKLRDRLPVLRIISLDEPLQFFSGWSICSFHYWNGLYMEVSLYVPDKEILPSSVILSRRHLEG